MATLCRGVDFLSALRLDLLDQLQGLDHDPQKGGWETDEAVGRAKEGPV
jgi:hypothetical protein